MGKMPRNPYLNRAMIRDPKTFFGRRQEFDRLVSRIVSDPPQCTALIGDRRIGKSSLLYYISHADVVARYLDAPDQTLFLFLDFQEEQRFGAEDFFRLLFRRLQAALEGRYEIRMPPDYNGFRTVLEALDCRGFRLILLLDEFDRIARSAGFDPEFFSYLRSLAGQHSIACITSSTQDLQQICRIQEVVDSGFFNIFSTLRLGPLRRDEALALIQYPSRETPFPLAEHAEMILDLAGFLPFFLQIACSAAFEILLEEGACRREAVCERFLEEAQPHFHYYWEHFDPVERAICNALACGVRVDRKRGEYQDLVKRGFVLEDGRLFSTPFGDFVRDAYDRDMGVEPVEVQAERLRSMERELEAARDMQMGLLPREQPQAEGLDIAGRCVPANHVGGDFHTYLWLDEAHTQLGVVAVDVMGKAMEAAVTALRFSETLRYEARGRTQPVDILGGLNRALHEILELRAFVGCCMGVIDLQSREIQVAVGGYYPPLHYRRRDDRVVEPELGNLPLGIRPDTEYDSACLALETGDILLFYSDGVVEAEDDRRTQYGGARTEELLLAAAHEGLDAEGVIERLFWDVGRFSAGAGQTDDMTAIAVRMT